MFRISSDWERVKELKNKASEEKLVASGLFRSEEAAEDLKGGRCGVRMGTESPGGVQVQTRLSSSVLRTERHCLKRLRIALENDAFKILYVGKGHGSVIWDIILETGCRCLDVRTGTGLKWPAQTWGES